MSIFERAVEKALSDEAQSNEKAKSAPSSQPPVRSATGQGPESRRVEPTSQASRRSSSESSSLTVRDLKPIVQVDVGRLRDSGRLPLAEKAQQTEEEIRRIKWPLLNSIAKRNGATPVRNNVILVTSALPGEGKTFTSLSLALSVVRDREMRVILIDGDVARPGLTPALGLEDRPGLNDVLEDECLSINAVTYQTDVEGLFVVPAGKWHDQAPEFFASSRMPQIISDLMSRVGNGVVIVDSPPLLATNEAQVITRYVGQVLLVVRADATAQRAVREAAALIDPSASVSAVLNGAKPSVLGRYYGEYSYGSGYGDEVRRMRRMNHTEDSGND